MFVKVERNMTNGKLIIYLCWAAAVCMENAIDPHHQCCFKCNLEKHTEQQGTQMFYLFVSLSQLFYVLDESEMWKQNSISPEWWKMFWYERRSWGGGARAEWMENHLWWDFHRRENLFYAFTAAQINLEVGWLFVNNKSRHNPSFVVKDLSFRYCFVSFTPALCCSHIELSAPRRRLSSWKSFSSSIHHTHGKFCIFLLSSFFIIIRIEVMREVDVNRKSEKSSEIKLALFHEMIIISFVGRSTPRLVRIMNNFFLLT